MTDDNLSSEDLAKAIWSDYALIFSYYYRDFSEFDAIMENEKRKFIERLNAAFESIAKQYDEKLAVARGECPSTHLERD